jgi:hypothetical protein
MSYIRNDKIHIEVGEYNLYNFDGPLQQMMDDLLDLVKSKVPAEHMKSVMVDFETRNEYDSSLPIVTISYSRPATKEDYKKQEKQDNTRRTSEIIALRRRIEQLEKLES